MPLFKMTSSSDPRGTQKKPVAWMGVMSKGQCWSGDFGAQRAGRTVRVGTGLHKAGAWVVPGTLEQKAEALGSPEISQPWRESSAGLASSRCLIYGCSLISCILAWF